MNGHEIRSKFLLYFEKQGHKIIHSSPLLPANDPTLLFVNAGMNQFKDVFLGNDKREYTRAVTSQKCLRAGGKHNDLDEVGKTARHHTFFEMLGNFSFGDYFKKEAIEFAWDFLVNQLGLEESRLWFTVFEGDDDVPADEEAVELWVKTGARRDRILRFGRKDNFWQMAETGPCGPSSEINYYTGDDPEDPEKNHPKWVNGEGDTTMEIWNLVFIQYNRIETAAGEYRLEPLPAPSIDTGMGLERITAVLEGKNSVYDTTLIKPIIDFIAELSGKNYEYDSQEGFAMRVVADHARATAFAITDGILPGNEGRNYVLRKIMRRAIYHGREHLGFKGLFFYQVCNFVVDQMREAYPELEAQRGFIEKMVRLEEERFGNTLTVGLTKLDEVMENYFRERRTIALENLQRNSNRYDMRDVSEKISPISINEIALERVQYRNWNSSSKRDSNEPFEHTPSVEQFFKNSWAHYIEKSENVQGLIKEFAKLYDTFGTPKDLIYVSLNDRGFEIAEESFDEIFNTAIKELQENSQVGKTKQNEKINPIYVALERTSVRSSFTGYGHDETTTENSEVIALVKDDQRVDELKSGEEGLVVLDNTPFYAEAGGQVGDTGVLVGSPSVSAGALPDGRATDTAAFARVFDTFAPISGIILHKSRIERGSIKVGDTVTATVDVEKRDATRRNHTATHLVHAALKEVLGSHVKQAGSVVAPSYLRFDFTHYQPLTDAEITEVETIVNRHILQNVAVNTNVMDIEEAMRSGAVALFGEKYGSAVRVLSVGDGIFSKELCGGTHVKATGDIGSFKITADEAIASGVRRIRAVTGFDAFERFREDEKLIDRSLSALRTQRDQLPAAIEKLQEELKRARKEMDELKLKVASGTISSSANGDEARDVAGVQVITKAVEGLDKGGMRHLSDTLLAKLKSGVIVLGQVVPGKTVDGEKEDDKVSVIVRVSDDLTEKIKAGNIIKEIAPIVGGRGGGKADMAEGGGTLPGKLGEALEASYGVIEKMLS